MAASKIHQHMHLFFTMPYGILPARFWPGRTANEAPSQPVSQASAPKASSNSKLEKMRYINATHFKADPNLGILLLCQFCTNHIS